MPGTLILHGLRFFGHHGQSDAERGLGSHFVVDLDLSTDFARAAESDQLADTISYPEVYELARRLTEETEFHLLEALAARLAGAVMAMPGVLSVRVRVTKQPRLPLQEQGFAVELVLPSPQ
jgi:dihydroneopterin aldolase